MALLILWLVAGCATSHVPVHDEGDEARALADAGPTTRPDASETDVTEPDAAEPLERFEPAVPDANAGECTPGVQRWCSDAIWDMGRQTCLADGEWGTCVEPVVTLEHGLVDRPNTDCGCRYFYFNHDCCEDQEDRDGDGLADCIIPEDWEPPACESDGSLCTYCDIASECGGEADACIYRGDGYTFCGRNCADEPCPDGYECVAIATRSEALHQCVPLTESCE